MSHPTSNRRLLLFLAVAVCVPVALVVGPFRDRFFPPQARAVAALALPLALPDAAQASALLGDALPAKLRDELLGHLAAGHFATLAVALERVEPTLAHAGIRYLHGLACLQDRHPAQGLASLQDAVQLAAPPLQDDARFALVQLLLELSRADEATRELSVLASGTSAHAATARQQLTQLAELR